MDTLATSGRVVNHPGRAVNDDGARSSPNRNFNSQGGEGGDGGQSEDSLDGGTRRRRGDDRLASIEHALTTVLQV